jgi:hypothetical protein
MDKMQSQSTEQVAPAVPGALLRGATSAETGRRLAGYGESVIEEARAGLGANSSYSSRGPIPWMIERPRSSRYAFATSATWIRGKQEWNASLVRDWFRRVLKTFRADVP